MKTNQSLKDIKARYETELKAALTKYLENESSAEEIVTKLLAKNQEEIILKLLGMNNTWGRWEIDNCNGRNPPISQYIESRARVSVEKFIDSQIGDLMNNKIVLTADFKKALKNIYDHHYKKTVEKKITELAQKKAQEDIQMLLEFM